MNFSLKILVKFIFFIFFLLNWKDHLNLIKTNVLQSFTQISFFDLLPSFTYEYLG